MFGNYSHDGVSHAACAFCVRTWDKAGSVVLTRIDEPVSIDAARHIAEALVPFDGQAKIICTTKGHDYQECWGPQGYRRGTFAQSTFVAL